MAKIIPPTVQQMRLFEAVARLGSITRAAEEVHLTQPSVSMQVKTLEEKIGQPLTEQIGKALQLTRAGEVVAAASRDVLARIAEMEAALDDMSRAVAGPLSVAVVSTAKYFLPELLGQFKRRFPRVEPRLQITNRETLLARMANNADDLYIMGRPPEEEAVIAEPFLENVIVFVARPDHPLVGRRHIPLGRMAEENVIRREAGSGTRAAVESLCAAAGVTLGAHMEFDDSEAIKHGVLSGLGVAYLSLHSLRLELAAGELALLDVEGFPLRRRWYAVHRRGKRLTNAGQAFLDYLLEESEREVALPGNALPEIAPPKAAHMVSRKTRQPRRYHSNRR
ncbi:LysR family transcriptional regulator [Sinisalibacter aestuarii]|uniref:HTH-type transcriptional regulator CbbR n=1 Tax=Sinisalibacter aestuarii TaxID=2949426 RepID=A0ABQ5LWH2_9RHOB|nr:LysR family transcriptional regulator [Sinisalibacter aestuarii]GKY89324.1 LysR family transcriptional regulator [Sinisalibacter aestuarii]